MEEFQRHYEEKLAALKARLEATEAQNERLSEKLDTALNQHETLKIQTDSRIQNLEKCVNNLKDQCKRQEKANNDLEQYSRRSHIRIRGLKIESPETCKAAVARFCTSALNVNISEEDLDAAHPLPVRTPQHSAKRPQTASDPAPIIVRFHRRDQRDSVIKARSALKSTGITITEDLTAANQKLLHHLYAATSVSSAWSWNGKILYTVQGSKKTHRLDIHDQIPT